ncbi:carbon-nitrogen hydrolase family protein [Thalassospira sp. ER-Se-21-Dark]|uniref:carbon-nitrogen hydrolase family protein n=1 Tax=Thalassospira sp. ER-Se-21-Dark TaxID=2585190 RepID=UPI001B3131AF|nr:carbon-nitrogen hydrolase family protein [Thalassospira sp. ER-Se-21-Dark]
MKISLIQTNPQSDRTANLARTKKIMEAAVAADKPDLIVLPEYFDVYGLTNDEKRTMAEKKGGVAYKFAQDFAREHGVFVHAGSVMERIEGEDRVFNTTFVFDRTGKEIAEYRKIHLFDVDTPDGLVYRESDSVMPGEDVVTYDVDGFTVGCGICYDIRFAELFIALQKKGCDLIVLPAAFTLQTGKDHWEVLARARAIETAAYFAACGQTGMTVTNGEKRACYGHSLVADPWGMLVAQASDGEGYITATLDKAQNQRVQNLIPVANHRRLSC